MAQRFIWSYCTLLRYPWSMGFIGVVGLHPWDSFVLLSSSSLYSSTRASCCYPLGAQIRLQGFYNKHFWVICNFAADKSVSAQTILYHTTFEHNLAHSRAYFTFWAKSVQQRKTWEPLQIRMLSSLRRYRTGPLPSPKDQLLTEPL